MAEYFYPRPPRGGRRAQQIAPMLNGIFLSTPSARRATCQSSRGAASSRISIHALREEGDGIFGYFVDVLAISIHALREEGDRQWPLSRKLWEAFLSTPSARRATCPACLRSCPIPNFYPRPPRGGRLQNGRLGRSGNGFLSTPSARRATFRPLQSTDGPRHFYPRPPRGGRQAYLAASASFSGISIHALREEGDCFCRGGRRPFANFYPRPPRGGRHVVVILVLVDLVISIHALREEGDRWKIIPKTLFTTISIHALREEGDANGFPVDNNAFLFLSTPSARRATTVGSQPSGKITISIHALREEGDSTSPSCGTTAQNFYPRPPRGGRPEARPAIRARTIQFLSTPSARRATRQGWRADRRDRISIHALREEGDPFTRPVMTCMWHFYPRPPRGGRRHRGKAFLQGIPISIHALREEGDNQSKTIDMPNHLFLSTPSARRATGYHRRLDTAVRQFLSTPSARRATGLPLFLPMIPAAFLSTPSARRATF